MTPCALVDEQGPKVVKRFLTSATRAEDASAEPLHVERRPHRCLMFGQRPRSDVRAASRKPTTTWRVLPRYSRAPPQHGHRALLLRDAPALRVRSRLTLPGLGNALPALREWETCGEARTSITYRGNSPRGAATKLKARRPWKIDTSTGANHCGTPPASGRGSGGGPTRPDGPTSSERFPEGRDSSRHAVWGERWNDAKRARPWARARSGKSEPGARTSLLVRRGFDHSPTQAERPSSTASSMSAATHRNPTTTFHPQAGLRPAQTSQRSRPAPDPHTLLYRSSWSPAVTIGGSQIEHIVEGGENTLRRQLGRFA